MKKILAIAAPLLALVSVAYAQTPESIAKSYFEMLRNKQWTQIAQLYDPGALRDFREMMSFLLEVPDESASQVLGALFGPGATKQGVKAMSEAEFFAAFLGGVMARSAQLGQLNFETIEVLGSVGEGDSLRHVVTRTHISLADMSMESMEVVSLKKVENEWKLLLQGKIKGMAQQIKKALERAQ